jgi:hemoglobin/transferrin/lactoferrin receptor protein
MVTWKCVVVLAGSVVCASAGLAEPAEIRGSVTDAAGGALPAVSVALENVATGSETAVATDAGGRFSFSSVPVGIYRIAALVRGFSQEARTVSLASPEESLDVSFSLSVGGLTADVMVTATRSARDTLDVPMRAETIGSRDIRERAPASTGSAMVAVPGITPVGDGPFEVRPRLRGLDSTRVLVLVDGERLNNARTATDRAGVEVGLAEVDSVQGIEVVSGSGSVLYGTDALSGTINVITDQPQLGDRVHFTGGLSGFFSTNEDGRRGALSLGVAAPRFAVGVSGALEKFDDYVSGGSEGDVLEDTRPLFTGPCPVGATTRNPCLDQADTIDDNFGFHFDAFPDPFNAPFVRATRVVPTSGFEGNNLNARALFALDDKQTVRVKYVRRHTEDVGFPDFEPPQFFQGIVLPFSNLDKVSGRYHVRNLSSRWSSLSATVYYQHQNRKLQNVNIPVQFPAPSPAFFPISVFRLLINSTTEQDVGTWGFDVQNTFLLSPRNVLTAGFTVYRDHSEDDRASSTQMNLVGQVVLGPRGPAPVVLPSLVPLGPPTLTNPVRVPDASFRDVGVFAQDEWDLSSRFKLVAGVRYDGYRVASEATPGYQVASLVSGAQPPIDPATLPSLDGQDVSRSAFTGDAGLVFKLNGHVSLTAHVGRSYRHPNLEELFFSGPATIGNIVPNIQVEPEKGTNLDFGVKVRTGRVAGSFGYFNNKYDGFISTEIVAVGCCGLAPTNPNSTVSQAINFSDVRIQGIEGDVEAPFTVGRALVTVFANASWNHGEILSGENPLTGVDLAGTPQDNITPFKLASGVRLSDRAGRFWLEYSNRHQKEVERVAEGLIGSRFLIAQDLYGLNGFTVHRVGAGVEWRRADRYGVGLSLNLENLSNEFYREQFQFAPARGRSFTIGLHLRRL